MWRKSLRTVCGLVLLIAASMLEAAPAVGQVASLDTLSVYRREVFTYDRARRMDPFRSLLNTADLGVRFEDLTLQGIMYHPNPARSVVILSQRGSTRRIQARVGDRIGGLTIVAVGPRTVEVIVEEFGVARRETMELSPDTVKGGTE
jgi:hypothetical protein